MQALFSDFFKICLIECLFRCPYGSDQGSLGWTKGPASPIRQDSSEPWTRCQKNVVSSLREMPANAVWPANIFLAIACDSVTQAWDARTYRMRPAVGGRSSDVLGRPAGYERFCRVTR